MLIPLARAEAPSRAPAPSYFSAVVRSLLALEPGGCRWPLGEPGQETAGFCGAARLNRSSYCGPHKALSCERVR